MNPTLSVETTIQTMKKEIEIKSDLSFGFDFSCVWFQGVLTGLWFAEFVVAYGLRRVKVMVIGRMFVVCQGQIREIIIVLIVKHKIVCWMLARQFVYQVLGLGFFFGYEQGWVFFFFFSFYMNKVGLFDKCYFYFFRIYKFQIK